LVTFSGEDFRVAKKHLQAEQIIGRLHEAVVEIVPRRPK
jgi:hypothetical protein